MQKSQKILLMIFILNLFFGSCLGQKNNGEELQQMTYSPGKAEKFSGDIITGSFAYSQVQKTLFWKQERGSFASLQADEVFQFSIDYGDEKEKYYSLPYDLNGDGFDESLFFEVLLEGDQLAVLRYALIELQAETVEYYKQPGKKATGSTILEEEVTYFLVHPSEGIIPVKDIDEELLKVILGDRYTEVMLYVKENRLRLKSTEEFIIAMEYYFSKEN